MKIRIQILDKTLIYPEYSHEGDAGLDLRSCTDAILMPFERKLIPTGIRIEIPRGYAGFVQPRSGLAIKNGISLVNTPGLIDSSYRGEIKAILINLDSKNNFIIKKGDRICQLVLLKVEKAEIIFTDELENTDRGENGFGSSGQV